MEPGAINKGLYRYDNLPRGRWFRVLKVLPGHFDDPLVCELVSIAFETAPPYKALSYVWGDHAKVKSITCSGFRRQITSNLFEGLRRIRSTDDVETAWADAICINQADKKERASHVDQMGEIYDRAAEVFVWLGEVNDGVAGIAFDALRHVNKSIRDGTDVSWLLRTGQESSVQQDPNVSTRQTTNLRNTLPTILTSSVQNAIQNLYQCPWFTRVWTLQEVGLATTATACWGSSYVEFQEIGEFIYHTVAQGSLTTVLREDIKSLISGSPFYALYNVWYTYDKENSWVNRNPVLSGHIKRTTEVFKNDILVVLEASRMMHSTDPLDHVFAFLGHPKALRPGSKEPLIQADYNIDLRTLHHLLASKFAETSLNFLVQVQSMAEDIELRNEEPSWIPQWHMNKPGAPIAFWEAFDASLVKSTPPSAKAVASVSKNMLKAEALPFDTVQAHTPTLKKSDFEDPRYECAALIEECWDFTAKFDNAYGESYLFAFATTLRWHHKTANGLEYSDVVRDLAWYCSLRKPEMLEKKLGIPLLTYDEGELSKPSGRRNYGFFFKEYGTNRKFFISAGGYFGIGPSCMQQGDVCAILFGGDVPFILRPTATEGRFRLVGQAYMHGAMYGEVVQKWEQHGIACGRTKICIV